jgi:hypothetical protein
MPGLDPTTSLLLSHASARLSCGRPLVLLARLAGLVGTPSTVPAVAMPEYSTCIFSIVAGLAVAVTGPVYARPRLRPTTVAPGALHMLCQQLVAIAPRCARLPVCLLKTGCRLLIPGSSQGVGGMFAAAPECQLLTTLRALPRLEARCNAMCNIALPTSRNAGAGASRKRLRTLHGWLRCCCWAASELWAPRQRPQNAPLYD